MMSRVGKVGGGIAFRGIKDWRGARSSNFSTFPPTDTNNSNDHRLFCTYLLKYEDKINTIESYQLRLNDDDLLVTPKPPEHTRLYFVNANGLHHGALGGEFAEACETASEEHIDIMGIAETHLNTKYPNLVQACAKAARRTFTHSRICMASSRRTYNASYKPGGTAMISNGPVTGHITQTHSDSMGRWCSTSY
ncbi:hypothetical protein IV203_030705 [Nitzschia inconspicua]|uniref:Uncharacterized protein n=1 Tax=Nitzschia inconspicua TaxID=303405 RepID=A0A9K3Q1H3_9STRA|nr:hypothetical protein IV203_030705 [Nitzschia inconspicua]